MIDDVNFLDDYFRPVNIQGAPPEKDDGNQRPMADLSAVEGHNDGFNEPGQYPNSIPEYGRGPSQRSGSKPAPKPTLVAEPNYWNEMAPTRGPTLSRARLLAT